MPDFDVQALSLASPPSAAPVTTYRPAVRVRNNGIHPANITGNLRIYRREPPGELLETHQLSLLNLGAGLEGDALSSGYWTPTPADIAREFLFTAHVDTEQDQNTSNNDLSPITVIVTAGEPPPPPGVLAHATQHETGGGDQIEITGLHGLTADAQTALAHKASHQAGGADAINVDGLLGTLAQGQPIADHHEEHEDGGGDELYVGGLRGQLADNQPALTHDNARHDPNYSIDPHSASDHDSSVEKTANKGDVNGYAGLGANGYVPKAQLGVFTQGVSDLDALRYNQSFGPANPVSHASRHENGGDDELSITGLPGLAADDQYSFHNERHSGGVIVNGPNPATFLTYATITALYHNDLLLVIADCFGNMVPASNPGQLLRLTLLHEAQVLATLDLPCEAAASYNFHFQGIVSAINANNMRASLTAKLDDQSTHASQCRISTSSTDYLIGSASKTIGIKAQWVTPNANSGLTVDFAVTRSVGPQARP